MQHSKSAKTMQNEYLLLYSEETDDEEETTISELHEQVKKFENTRVVNRSFEHS